jgi:hypothetical protein
MVNTRLHPNLRCPWVRKYLSVYRLWSLSWVVRNNVMIYVVYEQCIVQFSQNDMKLFCQACTSIKWSCANSHIFLIYYHYFITRWPRSRTGMVKLLRRNHVAHAAKHDLEWSIGASTWFLWNFLGTHSSTWNYFW